MKFISLIRKKRFYIPVILLAILLIGTLLLFRLISYYPIKYLNKDISKTQKVIGMVNTDVEKAKYILIYSTVFTTNAIGYQALKTPTSWAFSILFEDAQKNGPHNFIEVFDKSKFNEGRVYALFGLYWISKSDYERAKNKTYFIYLNTIWYCNAGLSTYNDIFKDRIPRKEFLDQLMISPIPSYSSVVTIENIEENYWDHIIGAPLPEP